MNDGFTLEGMDDFLRRLDALDSGIGPASARAVKKEAETIMTDSKRNYVPVEDGVLRNSGYVNDPEVARDSVSVEMGYGGAASAYAVVQHENLNFKHRDGRSAKYLEKPLIAAMRGMDERLAKAIGDEIERLAK